METSSNRQRIIVQVTNDESDDEHECHLKVVNTNTLELQFKTENHIEMQFDCVGSDNDSHILAEYSAIMQQLLMQHENCCLIQFKTERESPLAFLLKLLTKKADVRSHMLHAQINAIKLEYYELNKYELQSLWLQQNTLKIMKMPDNIKAHYQFKNIIEFINWLKEKFLKLWQANRGHDYIEIQFVCNNKYQVKFVLVQLYLSRMDSESKIELQSCLENFTSASNIKPLMLTRCLGKYLNNRSLWHSWFMFHVSSINVSKHVIDEMLNLANAAYVGAHKLKQQHKIIASGKALICENNNNDCLQAKSAGLDSKVTEEKPIYKSFAKDCDTLSHWYHEIDTKYSSACKAMEIFYERRFHNFTTQLCKQINYFVNTIDQTDQSGNEDEFENGKSNQHFIIDLYQQQYKTALSSFEQHMQHVRNCSFGNLLQQYMQIKMLELTKHAVNFKVELLRRCQTHLSEALKKEEQMFLNNDQVMQAEVEMKNTSHNL